MSTQPDNVLVILFVRHGQSEANARLNDDVDSVLTLLGERQAHLAGEWLAQHYGQMIDGFYSSEMIRARVTAQIIGSYLGLTPQPLPDFHEIDYWTHGFLPVFETPDHAIGGPIAEEHTDYGAFRVRIERALRALLTRHQQGTIVLVSHGAVMGTVIRILAGTSYLSISHQNTGITRLRWEKGRWHLDYVNRQEHLRDCEGYRY